MFRKKKKGTEEYEPTIILRDVKESGRKYKYHLKGCMVIGRSTEVCDIALPTERTVSSRQCRLYTEDDAVYITDLEGTNATYLNNQKIREDRIVKSGDVIGFGDVDFYITIK